MTAKPGMHSAFEDLLRRHMPRTFPALSFCVIHQGETIWQEARGWIDPDGRRMPVSDDSLFDLASVTKLIIETGFLVLVEAGGIGLESRLVEVLPEFGLISPREIAGGQDPHTRAVLPVERQYRGMTVDPAGVTFRHLLTHSSGLPPWRSVYLEAAAGPPPPPSHISEYEGERWRRGLQAMLGYPFAGAVGDRVRYSDIGIMLLGEAVARLHGGRLDRAINDLVLQPLGLDSFTYNPMLKGAPRESIVPTERDNHWRHRRAWGEVHDENACGVGGIAGHAGLFATAQDVARFGQAWLAGAQGLGISAGLRRMATSQQATGQFRLGLGWMLKAGGDSSAGDLYGASSYGHTGFTGTSLWVDPERELVSAVLSNRVYHGRDDEGIYAFRRGLHDLIVERVDS
ncbi:MAG: serine hydrolase [Chloroflexota bacterium]|nr:serine hydrolase [Chloroflexota bacterium]MDE2946450.1 serine hydrolase [Chloroflexota bacterium]